MIDGNANIKLCKVVWLFIKEYLLLLNQTKTLFELETQTLQLRNILVYLFSAEMWKVLINIIYNDIYAHRKINYCFVVMIIIIMIQPHYRQIAP